MRSASLLLLLLTTLGVRASDFDVRPIPGWVERFDVDASAPAAKENARWGIYDLLTDHQVRTGDGAESHVYRTVRMVLSASGVQNASELSLDFDPSFERLTIHEISLLRGGRRIDALEPDEIRVIDREDEADSGIYAGQKTALVFLKDVRAGDVIDYSWSIDGANPLLGGHYTDDLDLSPTVPTARLRHRIVWPAGKPLQWRGADPAIVVRGSQQVFTWERTDVPPLGLEDDLPSWYEPWETVQVTEFESWHEVAGWAAAMFRLDARSREEVRRLAAGISAGHPERDARITAAIRFVQDEIRYLGIEMGRNSHQPHQPWETLEQRWGDCKDKTLLLVALLRELGLQADPALVSTSLQHRLEQKLPTPFLFDHAIARVVDGGRTYWIDATIADQGGTLATIETPNDGAALIVAAETTALTPIHTTTDGSTVVEQVYTTFDYKTPVVLEVTTTWTGQDADAKRADLATISLEDLASERINQLAIDQPKITPGGLPEVSDDRERNVIVVKERYSIPGLWSDGAWTWYPRVLESYLSRPETMIRSMPLAFPWPLHVEQRVTFNFPEDVGVEKSNSVTETAAFRYSLAVDSNGRSITVRHVLRAKRDAIAAAEVSDHLTRLSAISSEMAFHLAPPGAGPSPPGQSWEKAQPWILGFAVVVMFVATSLWLATRRRTPPASTRSSPAAPGFRPGDAPASALPVHGPGEMEIFLAAHRCVCGADRLAGHDIQRARYAERDMTIVVRRCEACGREQSTYFTAA